VVDNQRKILMTYGRCITCGEPGVERERRPNGNTTCANGHTWTSATFDRHELSAQQIEASKNADADYRSRVDPEIESLGMVLIEIGDKNDPLSDDALVKRAAGKLRMLYEMLIAAGVSEGILKAAVRS
jgi:hypothetical protein